MQKLDSLWKLVNVAASVRDMAQETRQYRFVVAPHSTLYLHTESAHISLQRSDNPELLIQTELQGGFGWRVATEQDELGVYVVAKRRAVVGGLSSARFSITAPHTLQLAFKLEQCHLELRDLTGFIRLPQDIIKR